MIYSIDYILYTIYCILYDIHHILHDMHTMYYTMLYAAVWYARVRFGTAWRDAARSRARAE